MIGRFRKDRIDSGAAPWEAAAASAADSAPETDAESGNGKRSAGRKAKARTRAGAGKEKPPTGPPSATRKRSRDSGGKRGERKRGERKRGGSDTGPARPLRAVIIDGSHLTTVSVKRGEAAITEIDCDGDPLKAVKRAAKMRGATIIWGGRVSTREMRDIPDGLHPAAHQQATLTGLQMVYGDEPLVAAKGKIALAADADEEMVRLLRKKRKLVASAFSVGDKSGAWIRLGHTIAEATLVLDGEVKAYAPLGPGLDSITAMVHESGGKFTTDQAIAEMATRVASEASGVFSRWQQAHIAVPEIWLHGPGANLRDKIADTLLDATQCRVLYPVVPGLSLEGQPSKWSAPGAVYSANAPRLVQTKILATRRRFRLVASTVAMAAAFVGALVWMWTVSTSTGAAREVRLADAQARQAAAEVIINQAEFDLSAEAERAAETLKLLNAGSARDPWLEAWPDWLRVVELADSSVSVTPRGMDVQRSSIPGGIEGNMAARRALDTWGREVFGPATVGQSDTSVSLTYGDSEAVSAIPVPLAELTAELTPEEIALVAPLAVDGAVTAEAAAALPDTARFAQAIAASASRQPAAAGLGTTTLRWSFVANPAGTEDE